MELPWFSQKHGYIRYDFNWYRPEDRAVDGSTQAINDGDFYRIVAGVDGALGSEKITGRAELGYASWDTNENSGISGDDSNFNNVVGLLEVAGDNKSALLMLDARYGGAAAAPDPHE